MSLTSAILRLFLAVDLEIFWLPSGPVAVSSSSGSLAAGLFCVGMKNLKVRQHFVERASLPRLEVLG